MTSQSHSMTWSKMTTLSILVSTIWHQHCQTFFKISSKSNKVMVGYINIVCFNLLTVTCSLRSCCLIFLKSGNLLNTTKGDEVSKIHPFQSTHHPNSGLSSPFLSRNSPYVSMSPKVLEQRQHNTLMTRSIKYIKSSLAQVPGWLFHGLWHNSGQITIIPK